MSKVLTSFRLDRGDKEAAKAVLAGHGMTLTDGVSEYLRHVALTGDVPRFEQDVPRGAVLLGAEGVPGSVEARLTDNPAVIEWTLPDGRRGTYSLQSGDSEPEGVLGRRELARLDSFAERLLVAAARRGGGGL